MLWARWVQSLERAGLPLEGLAAAVGDGALSLSFMDVPAFDRFAGLSGTTFQLSAQTGMATGRPGPRGRACRHF
jgi:hypothetical protein